MAITILQQPASLLSSGNRIYFVVSSDMYNAAGYELTAQIYLIEDDSSLTELPKMKIYPNGEGKSDIDISKILHNRFKPIFPDIDKITFSKLSGFTLRFKVVFRETHKAGIGNEKESDTFTVVKAKFPAKQSVTGWVGSQNYLSNQGNYIETARNSVHYLVVIFRITGSYSVKMTVNYKDGTAENKLIGNINVISAYEIYAIPTGLRHLVFEKEPAQYTIWVQNSSGATAFRKMTYIIRPKSKNYSSLLYLNILGGIDSVIVSEMTGTMKTERESYRVDGLNLQSRLTDYSDTFEVTTGYINTTAAKLCRELLISDQVYILHNESLIPVNIEKGSYKLYDENNDLQSLSIKYSFTDPSYPVLNDNSGGISPDPDPEPDGTVLACCPDGVDDYLHISGAVALAMMFIYPTTTGTSTIYSLDMIPIAGPTFSIGNGTTFYLGVMYTGSGLIIQAVFNKKSYLIYQETKVDYSNRRVTLKLTVKNENGTLAFSLLINDAEEPLNVIDDTGGNSQVTNTGTFCRLFNNGIEENICGSSQIISFAISNVASNGNVTPKVLWNFEGITSAERLKNKISGGTNYDLVAKNVTNTDQLFKDVSYNY